VHPLIAILDWMMPSISGVDICRRLRASKARPYVYVVILTAKDEQPDLIKAMEAGADDYLSKPFDADELRVRLAAGWRVLALQDELRTKALHDDLTGLLNRGGILDVARREVAKTVRLGAPMAVVLADVDHFKDVNDVHGPISATRSSTRPRSGSAPSFATTTRSAAMAVRNSSPCCLVATPRPRRASPSACVRRCPTLSSRFAGRTSASARASASPP
jgi:CheY-like chemotaxis protein